MSPARGGIRLLLAGALILAGCDAARDAGAEGYTVRDSAGIRIVQNSGAEPTDAEIARGR